MKFDTHLCLASAQATPNLAPSLAADFRPRKVALAVSPDMEKRAAWLTSVLRRHGVRTERVEISDPYDYYDCWDRFAGWLGGQTGELALNVTGGTKVMAMAAQDVFLTEKKPVFYVNVENDQVIRLDKRGVPFTLSAQVKLPEYLEAHGYSVLNKNVRPRVARELRDSVNRLAYESERLGRAFGRLNAIAQQAKGKLVYQLDERDRDSVALGELISEFKNMGMLESSDNKVLFPDEDARKFVNGGWLEYLIYYSLSDLEPQLKITDYAIGMEVAAPDGKTINELDAACLLRNTLHLIECKSANLSAPDAEERTAGTEALYKLDALRRMGGSRTKALLVDYRGALRDADKRRAVQMGLHVISGSQLKKVRGELKAWLK